MLVGWCALRRVRCALCVACCVLCVCGCSVCLRLLCVECRLSFGLCWLLLCLVRWSLRVVCCMFVDVGCSCLFGDCRLVVDAFFFVRLMLFDVRFRLLWVVKWLLFVGSCLLIGG